MKPIHLVALSLVFSPIGYANAPLAHTDRGFTIHTAESAPEASRAAVQNYVEKMGSVPNMAAVMAESPALLLAYKATRELIAKSGSLTGPQSNVVQMATSRQNECIY